MLIIYRLNNNLPLVFIYLFKKINLTKKFLNKLKGILEKIQLYLDRKKTSGKTYLVDIFSWNRYSVWHLYVYTWKNQFPLVSNRFVVSLFYDLFPIIAEKAPKKLDLCLLSQKRFFKRYIFTFFSLSHGIMSSQNVTQKCTPKYISTYILLNQVNLYDMTNRLSGQLYIITSKLHYFHLRTKMNDRRRAFLKCFFLSARWFTVRLRFIQYDYIIFIIIILMGRLIVVHWTTRQKSCFVAITKPAHCDQKTSDRWLPWVPPRDIRYDAECRAAHFGALFFWMRRGSENANRTKKIYKNKEKKNHVQMRTNANWMHKQKKERNRKRQREKNFAQLLAESSSTVIVERKLNENLVASRGSKLGFSLSFFPG